MGLDPLGAFLRRHRRLALDASVFMYQLEANPRYVSATDRVFSWLERPDWRAVASTVALTELLVAPYRAADAERAELFYALLSSYPNLEWVAPDLPIADLAARLRAEHGLRTPHALHAATAIRCQATGMITNDAVFRRVAGFETFMLDQPR